MCYRSASRSLTFTDYAFDVGTAGSKVATIWFLRLFYYFMSAQKFGNEHDNSAPGSRISLYEV